MKNLGKRKSEKIKNNLKKGGGKYEKSNFQGGNFYQLEYNSYEKKTSVFYYLTDEGFSKTDMRKFANSKTSKGFENSDGLDAYVYLYNLYGTPGGYLEAVKLESITDLLMLRELNFENLELTGSDDIKYNFQGANLKGANFANAILKHVNFNNAELENANFFEAELHSIIFSEANLKNATFQKTNFYIVSYFDEAKLENANFTEAIFEKLFRSVDFEDAELKNAKFSYARFGIGNANFTDSKLQGANFQGAELEQADFKNANLEGANLEGANLEGANLEEANLKGANLKGANLKGVNLEGVIIYHAIFTNAIINQALRNAINNKKPLIKSNDFISIPETNNIHRRRKIAIPNNLSPNVNDYIKTLEKLANELHKRKILPLDNTKIIDKSVVNLLQTNYIGTANIHSHIKKAIKTVRIFLLRIQFQELEQKIMSNNF